jgi:hypothetical protein
MEVKNSATKSKNAEGNSGGAFFAGVINAIRRRMVGARLYDDHGQLDGNEEKACRLVDLVYARLIDGVIILANSVGSLDQKSVLDATALVLADSAALDRPVHPTCWSTTRPRRAAFSRTNGRRDRRLLRPRNLQFVRFAELPPMNASVCDQWRT